MKKLIIVSLLLGLFACKTAEEHLQKFHEKGGTIEPTIVTVHDTIPGKDGKDSIVVRLVEIPCPPPIPPKTRWEVRFDNKRFKDSLKHVRKTYSDSLDYQVKVLKLEKSALEDSLDAAVKMNKQNQRTERTVTRQENKKGGLFWVGFIIGSLIMLVIFYLYRRFKKVLFSEN